MHVSSKTTGIMVIESDQPNSNDLPKQPALETLVNRDLGRAKHNTVVAPRSQPAEPVILVVHTAGRRLARRGFHTGRRTHRRGRAGKGLRGRGLLVPRVRRVPPTAATARPARPTRTTHAASNAPAARAAALLRLCLLRLCLLRLRLLRLLRLCLLRLRLCLSLGARLPLAAVRVDGLDGHLGGADREVDDDLTERRGVEGQQQLVHRRPERRALLQNNRSPRAGGGRRRRGADRRRRRRPAARRARGCLQFDRGDRCCDGGRGLRRGCFLGRELEGGGEGDIRLGERESGRKVR